MILTYDHIIGGKPASEWEVGELIPRPGYHTGARVLAVDRNMPIECGDLLLEGRVPYLANGFAVTSMFPEEEEDA
jgi:hypothetical protein